MFRQSTGKDKKIKTNKKKNFMKLCKTTVTAHSTFVPSHNVLSICPCILKTGFNNGHSFLDSLMEKHPFFHFKYII